MRYIRHMVILYNREEEAAAEFLSSFFRMVGIYVLQRVVEELTRQKELDYKDYVLVLNNTEDEIVRAAFREENWLDIRPALWKRHGDDGKDADGRVQSAGTLKLLDLDLEQFLGSVLLEIEKKRAGDGDSARMFRCLEALAHVYVESQIWYSNYHLRLFAFPADKRADAIAQIISDFSNAQQMAEQAPVADCPYLIYFMQECRRKINLACRLGKREKKYYTESMIQEICAWAGKYPEYTAFWLQAALVADEDIDRLYEAEEYYWRQLDEETDPEDWKYQGYTWYRLGRFYEKVKRNGFDRARECYHKAYRLSPYNYRFTYKMALVSELSDNRQQAVMYYEKILNQLQPYIQGNYLTICKCEYAFKVAIKLMKLYKSQMQYRMARNMGELAVRIRGDMEHNCFLESFYPDSVVPVIKEGMKERLDIRYVEEELGRLEVLVSRYF